MTIFAEQIDIADHLHLHHSPAFPA